MSKVTKKAIGNSVLLISNAFLAQGLGFIAIFIYSRVLQREDFGALASNQAQVLLWIMLVDLGLYNGLIGTMTAYRKSNFSHKSLVGRVFALRILGVSAGTIAIFYLSYLEALKTGQWNHSQFLISIAFTPYLLGFAIQQTLTPYLSFLDRQPIGVYANLAGITASTLLAIFTAIFTKNIALILLAISTSGYIASLILFFSLLFGEKNISSANAITKYDWLNTTIWKSLLKHSWPYAFVFASAVIWQRMDQIITAKFFGLSAAAEYFLAAKIVSVPVLLGAAINIALFPDFQRIGEDAPEKLEKYLGLILKILFRYGFIFSLLSLFAVSVILSTFFSKFEDSKKLVLWFAPGLWAYWLYNFTYNALFAFKHYILNVLAHALSTILYIISLLLLPKYFGLYGIVLSYNIFCISLFLFTFFSLIWKRHITSCMVLWQKLNSNEKIIFQKMDWKLWKKNR